MSAINRRALLIGIDEYPKFPLDHRLRGGVNDANLMADRLREQFAFPSEQVRVLLNAEATREAILGEFDRMISETSQDDAVVIFYSGHGSRMRDREKDEPDGWDETIVPYDSGRVIGREVHENRDITDDEIYLKLRSLGQKTGNITLIFDSCNSGTITRDVFGGASRWLPADERELSDLPPSPIPEADWPALCAAVRDAGPSKWLPISNRYVLISSCRDEESSNEYPPAPVEGTPFHGALTFFLHRELVSAGPGTTYRDVFDRARSQVTAVYPLQHPQMEGARDRELFGVTDIVPMQFVPITLRAGSIVTLAAGLAHGMSVGSRFGVYPSTAKQPNPQMKLGQLIITGVEGLTSTARIEQTEADPSIIPGARAVEEEHNFGDLSLKLEVVTPPGELATIGERLKQRIALSRMAQLANSGDVPFARAYLIEPRPGAGSADPAPQLGGISEPTWAIVAGGGQLLMPPRRAADPKATDIIVENLEKIARYRNLLEIKNPNPANPLDGMIDFTLLRKNPSGTWDPAQPDRAGRIVYKAGECLALRIVNRQTLPLFINVLDFGVTAGVTPIYPYAEGANEQLVKGRPCEFGVRDDETLTPLIPPEMTENEGVETLKLIAATREIDFSWLRQEGVRSVRGGSSHLDDLLWRAGAETRATRSALPITEDWITVERSFILAR
jgi:hypothetical protein